MNKGLLFPKKMCDALIPRNAVLLSGIPAVKI